MSKTYVTKSITRVPLVAASERKGIIGGSQIGTIVGVEGCYSSEFETYQSYMGVQEDPSESAKESFYAGNRLEEAIAMWFSHDMKQPVKELDYMYVDPEEPRLVLHPDREFVNEIDGKRYALECKTASVFAMRGTKWPELVPMDPDKVPSFVPKTLDDGRPLVIYDGSKSIMPGYYCQCLWYMALAGYDGVFLSRMTDNRLYTYYVEPDVETERRMYNIVRNWLKRVDTGYVPSPKTVEEARKLYPYGTKDKTLFVNEKISAALSNLKAKIDIQDKIDAEVEEAKARFINEIGDAEIIKNSTGKVVATFKGGSQTRFDSASLKKADPDLYSRYTKTIETARTLRLTN